MGGIWCEQALRVARVRLIPRGLRSSRVMEAPASEDDR